MSRRDAPKRRARTRDGGAEGPTSPISAPEFSRALRVSALGAEGERVRAKAEPAELTALAARFGVPEVRRMEVDAQIRPAGDGWRVDGVARARLVQTCVVTLEPVAQRLEERFSRRLEPGAPPPDLTDLDPDEEEDPPEPLGETLDPAEMAAEAIALAIEPYPRAPDVDFVGAQAAPPGAGAPEETAVKPFAGLAALREKLAGKPGGGDGEGE